MIDHCVILAGGLGTRMRPMTDRLPKALLPVNGVPFAHHQLTWLAGQGVRRIVYSIGTLGHMVREFVGDGRRWGLDVAYVEDGPTLRGTAGALRKALDEELLPPAFLVVYGDSYLPIDVRAVAAAFEASDAPALMTVLRNDGAWDTSNVVFGGGLVTLYDKRPERRPRDMRYIDYGLSVLTADVVASMVDPGGFADLSDVFHALSTTGRLAGYEVTERFYEIGSPAGLADLEMHLGR